MDVWTFIQKKTAAGINIMLLYVLKSEGSSPGRKGFKMAVAADGEICGTIGGGIMEHKLVEKAKSMLQQKELNVLLMQQYHDKEKAGNQSGMICSGSQLNVFVPLICGVSHPQRVAHPNTDLNRVSHPIGVTHPQKHPQNGAHPNTDLNRVSHPIGVTHPINTIETIVKNLNENKSTVIQLSPMGLALSDETAKGLQYNTDANWLYSEAINQQPVIHIIGGGHVGLALSELMHYLGFYIKLYDDRPELNTIAANTFVHEKHIVNYASIVDHFVNSKNDYVVIMTIGYRTDKIVLKQLIDKSFFYLGLLGSQHKVDTLFKELLKEGITQQLLDKVSSPVGLNINSKTSREIAVSIVAEIIRKKNK